jgi:hypothetical protein
MRDANNSLLAAHLVHFGTRGQKGRRTPFPSPLNICYNKVLSAAGRNQERFGGSQAMGI